MINPIRMRLWPWTKFKHHKAVVGGWYLVLPRYFIMQWAVKICLFWVMFFMLCVSVLPVFFGLQNYTQEGTWSYAVLPAIAWWRHDVLEFLYNLDPQIAEVLLIDPQAMICVPLLVVSVAGLMTTRMITAATGRGFARVLGLLVKRPYRVAVSAKRIRVGFRLLDRTKERVQVNRRPMYRSIHRTHRQNPQSGKHGIPQYRVEIVYGWSTYIVGQRMSEAESERVTVLLQQALQSVQPHNEQGRRYT